ncbi:Na+/H+ antiporter NhaC family protein [Tepidibacillus fermentans]|uniref:Transporter (NhaC family) n=1 Tax=Tepidibacillus fermentans TaxID=1281767 RepID=A0A4R3K9N4_9BACI|nr:Na+/H+ antiporter NhaC family protein [Tepidibacillus fermentans]TCS79583.1 transporter (NhaC family) [Tepidibacillus fermentans]
MKSNTSIPFIAAIIPILLTVSFLVMSVFLFKLPLYIPLLFGYVLSLGIAFYYHKRLKEFILSSYQGIKSIFMIVIIMILIGVLIAIWSSSGTIDALVYYGLAIIRPKYLVVISFLVSSMVSMLLGTSVGTMSTVGVAFMGIAHRLGINPSLVAGALVSGAFVGDRTSPLSSAQQMNTIITKTDYHENLKELLKTLIPAMVITTIIYFLLKNGMELHGSNLVEGARLKIKAMHPVLSPILLLPPIGILIFAIFRIPTKTNFLFGIISGAILAYLYQGQSWNNLMKYGIFGYSYNGSLYGGGLNMLNQVFLIFVAGAFLGVLEASGILATILKRLIDSLTTPLSLVGKTMVVSILSAILSSTQAMAIIVPGKVLYEHYQRFQLKPELLNRIISDSGMVVAGLIPWNLNAILLAVALNISVLDYLPYAYLLIILPILSYFQYHFFEQKKEKTNGRNFAKNNE